MEAIVHMGKLTCKRRMYFSHNELTTNCFCKDHSEATRAHLRRVKLEGTVDAGGHAGEDDSGVAFKAFGPAVDERNDGALVHLAVLVHQQRQLHRRTEGMHVPF